MKLKNRLSQWRYFIHSYSYRKIKSRGILIFLSLFIWTLKYLSIVILQLIFSNQMNLWINLFLQSSIPFIFTHQIFISLIQLYLFHSQHCASMRKILLYYQTNNISKMTHTYTRIVKSLFPNISHSMKKTSSSRFNFWIHLETISAEIVSFPLRHSE